jgi:thioredoxin 1
MAGAVIELTDDNFADEVQGADRPMLVDFWAEWCQPCKFIAPVIEQLAAQHGDRLRVAKLDIQANPTTPQRFNIMAIPALLLFKGGRPVMQLSGSNDARSVEVLMGKLEPHLG